MLDAIGAGLTPRIGSRDWKDIWLESPEYRKVRQEIEQIKLSGSSHSAPERRSQKTCPCASYCFVSNHLTPFIDAASFWSQLKEVTKRNSLALWRSPDYVFSRLFIHVFISLWVSLSFLQLGHSQRDLQYRVFAM